MREIFQTLGYQVSKSKTAYSEKLELLVITNSDGSVRWAWPAYLSKPLFLKFYNVSTLRSRLFSMCIKLVFFLRIQRVIFDRKLLYVKLKNSVSDFNLRGEWAIFTGTTGPNNKAICYYVKNGKGFFMKIATTQSAQKLIYNEAMALNQLFSKQPQTFSVPDIAEYAPGTLTLTDISTGKERSTSLGTAQLNALIELNEISAIRYKLNDLNSWKKLQDDLKQLQNNTDERLPKGMIRKLEKIIEHMDSEQTIEVCFSHGDFTPWNMFVKDHKPYIYDWELSCPLQPLGFDAFHFIIQQGILVERKRWKQIREDIDRTLTKEKLALISKFGQTDVDKYLRLYLIFNTVYYLKVYSNQANWHTQVYWLLNTWNEALSTLSAFSQKRAILAADVFDFLGDKEYAALKFPNMPPEKLGELSDIDLCINKQATKNLTRFIKQHPLVLKTRSVARSYMHTLQVFCTDGSILSLDLIWQLKRRHLEMLSIKEIFKNSYVNSFGVKMPAPLDNSRYIGLFYLLNNAPIPDRYSAYGEILMRSEKTLDQMMGSYFIDDQGNKKNVSALVKKMPFNTGLHAVRNILNYLFDTLYCLVQEKGLVITFSGVDGAGKSTVIERTKLRIEKQLRKKVIVIRHRPSMLPILSSFQKGKANAESDAAKRLPRTGTNKNTLSSLLRFTYYYSDYLIGQLMVYVKYVSRGYVVLYDRYYFDFINDSRRSNIDLPRVITLAGFHLLIKPEINFFLYARPEVILQRKRELDSQTIAGLNDKYLSLFGKFKKQYPNSTYQAVENLELETTLDSVFKTIVKQVA